MAGKELFLATGDDLQIAIIMGSTVPDTSTHLNCFPFMLNLTFLNFEVTFQA